METDHGGMSCGMEGHILCLVGGRNGIAFHFSVWLVDLVLLYLLLLAMALVYSSSNLLTMFGTDCCSAATSSSSKQPKEACYCLDRTAVHHRNNKNKRQQWPQQSIITGLTKVK